MPKEARKTFCRGGSIVIGARYWLGVGIMPGVRGLNLTSQSDTASASSEASCATLPLALNRARFLQRFLVRLVVWFEAVSGAAIRKRPGRKQIFTVCLPAFIRAGVVPIKCNSFPVPLPGKRPKLTLRERLKVPSVKRLY